MPCTLVTKRPPCPKGLQRDEYQPTEPRINEHECFTGVTGKGIEMFHKTATIEKDKTPGKNA